MFRTLFSLVAVFGIGAPVIAADPTVTLVLPTGAPVAGYQYVEFDYADLPSQDIVLLIVNDITDVRVKARTVYTNYIPCTGTGGIETMTNYLPRGVYTITVISLQTGANDSYSIAIP